MQGVRRIESDAAMRALGAELVRLAGQGDVVALTGPLGAGKTTLVRGALESLGWVGAVRSPTFALLIPYPTEPPVLHADLYRVGSAEGIGLEDFLDDHILFLEWPPFDAPEPAIRVEIEFDGEARLVRIDSQTKTPPTD